MSQTPAEEERINQDERELLEAIRGGSLERRKVEALEKIAVALANFQSETGPTVLASILGALNTIAYRRRDE